ncbi:MAG: DUF4199 domain-containing protein [Bacteroidota bacterium]
MKNDHAIKFGLLAGFGTILFLFIFYSIDKKLILDHGVIWSTMFLYIIGMYMAPIEERKNNDGYIEFKPALKAAFLVWVVANGLYHAYNYLLFNFIDPEMLSVQRQFMRDNMGQLEGVLTEEMAQAVEDSIEFLNFDFMTVFTTYLSSLVGGFLIAVVVARMVRRNPPVEEQV